MSNETTPRPWRRGKVGDTIVSDVAATQLQDADCSTYYGGFLVAESMRHEDRDLIIAAVNDHDALAAENKRLRETLESIKSGVITSAAMRDVARKALAQHGAAEATKPPEECMRCADGQPCEAHPEGVAP